MQRYIALVLCLVIILSLLTSCSGYNYIMRNHLSDETNYHSYYGEILDIYYYNDDNKKVSLLSSDKIPECDVVIKLNFDDRDTIKKFLGAEPNPRWSLDKYYFLFEITKENHKILAKNGFYDSVAMSTPIEITASSYIYMDSNFFYIAAVTYNETEYLLFEDGIQNIKKHINKRKSLL